MTPQKMVEAGIPSLASISRVGFENADLDIVRETEMRVRYREWEEGGFGKRTFEPIWFGYDGLDQADPKLLYQDHLVCFYRSRKRNILK